MKRKQKTDRIFVYGNFVIVGYFALLGLLYLLKIDDFILNLEKDGKLSSATDCNSAMGSYSLFDGIQSKLARLLQL